MDALFVVIPAVAAFGAGVLYGELWCRWRAIRNEERSRFLSQ
jgi:hypothetical protein